MPTVHAGSCTIFNNHKGTQCILMNCVVFQSGKILFLLDIIVLEIYLSNSNYLIKTFLITFLFMNLNFCLVLLHDPFENFNNPNLFPATGHAYMSFYYLPTMLIFYLSLLFNCMLIYSLSYHSSSRN